LQPRRNILKNWKRKAQNEKRPCSPDCVECNFAKAHLCFASKGSTIKSAAILCGCSERAFHSWMERGKGNEQPYKRFFDAASRAREQHKANLIAVVREAAHKDARHAEWLLERQFPHEFAPYDRRPIPVEPELEKKINVAFVVDTKDKSLQEVASFPVLTTQQAMPEPERERELTAGELFDGNIGKLGRVVHDVPLS
jgi:transcription elongation factor Elf1